MNPAAPSPSDSSIAQAFRECSEDWQTRGGRDFADEVYLRAREIDASAPAAAVGGDPDSPLHELFADLRVRFRSGNSVPVERAHITADEFRRICEGFANWSTIKPDTPAAPVGGFVVVPSKFHVSPDAWEAITFATGGPATGKDEPYFDCTLWVGEIEGDDGSKTYGLHVSCDECPEEGSITLAEFPAPTAQPSAKDGVRGDEPALPWRDISELEPSDDPHWFLRKDGRDWVVDGPRATQNHSEDQEDGWQWFCECESPPISATTAAGLVDGVTETTVLTACNAYDDAARLDGETDKKLAQYPWMHAALIDAQNNGWHVNGWRKVDGISVFSITPPSGLLATQQFVKYDAYLSAVASVDLVMAQDAKRYRFIRDNPWQGTPLERVITTHRNAEWDEEIDAAIGREVVG